MAIALVFLDQNVFNVIKYVLMTITISYASDGLLAGLLRFKTTKSLLSKGWARPSGRTTHIRFKRGIRFIGARDGLGILLLAAMFTLLELLFEFSTDSEPVWTTRVTTIKTSNVAENITSLLDNSAGYLSTMREALQRVEGTCYSVEGNWFYTVSFNTSSENDFQGLGRAAKCFTNYTEKAEKTDATGHLKGASYFASEFTGTGLWSEKEVRLGRDEDGSEVFSDLPTMGEVRVGPLEKFSFLTVNFSDDWFVDGSREPLTGPQSEDNNNRYYTGTYTIGDGKVECLLTGDDDYAYPEACLLPATTDKMFMGLYDDIEGTEERQLIIFASFDDFQTFRDLDALKASSWMVGTHSGAHTYREISVQSVISSHMIKGIPIDGFQSVSVTVGDKLVSAPTVTLWGLILMATAILLIVVGNFWIKHMETSLSIKEDLSTANGVAVQWLSQMKRRYDYSGTHGTQSPAVLVLETEGEDSGRFISVKNASDCNYC